MRIDSSGNVGIGIVPSVKLEVNGGSDGSVVFSGRSDGGNGNNQRFNLIAFADGGGSGYGGGLKIQTRSSTNVFSDVVTVSSSGAVGIGTSSPDAQGGNQSTILNLEGSDNLVYFSGGSGGNAIDDGFVVEGVATGVSSGDKRTGSILMTRANTSTTSLDSKIAFYTTDSGSHAERMRIDSSGNLLVGTNWGILVMEQLKQILSPLVDNVFWLGLAATCWWVRLLPAVSTVGVLIQT